MQHRPSRAFRTAVSTLTVLATAVMPYAGTVSIAHANESAWYIHGPDSYINSPGGWSGGLNVRISDDIRMSANSGSDVIQYYDFGIVIPTGATINGIEVTVEGYTSSMRQIEISLSSDGGTSYTTGVGTGVKTTDLPADAVAPFTDDIRMFGGPSDLWNRAWVPADFADGSSGFRLKLDATTTSPGNRTVYVDQLLVRVHYTPKKRGGGSPQYYGTLVLEKYIRSEATASFDEFRYDVDGAQFGSRGRFDESGRNTFENVPVGPYFVYEEAEGYEASYGGSCDENGEVTVMKDESATCTVTNTADGWEDGDPEYGPSPTPTPEPEDEDGDGGGSQSSDNGTLVVEKVILFGEDTSASYTDFSFTVGSESYPFEEDGTNEQELEPGSYTVVEDFASGWTTAYGGDCDSGGNVLVPEGKTRTCVVTNTLGVGGFNPGSDIPAPVQTPTPTPPPPVRTPVPTPTPSPKPSETPAPTTSISDESGPTAALGAFLPPCMPGQLSWIILNGLLFVILMWWLSRDSGFRWLRSLLVLAVAAGFMLWWQSTCGAEPRWLAAILAAIVLLRLRLRNR